MKQIEAAQSVLGNAAFLMENSLAQGILRLTKPKISRGNLTNVIRCEPTSHGARNTNNADLDGASAVIRRDLNPAATEPAAGVRSRPRNRPSASMRGRERKVMRRQSRVGHHDDQTDRDDEWAPKVRN